MTRDIVIKRPYKKKRGFTPASAHNKEEKYNRIHIWC